MAEQKVEDAVLYYHQGFGGRGSLVCFALALAGRKFSVADKDEAAKNKGAEITTGFPNFAFPVLKIDGALLSQTFPICAYVMGKAGMVPKDLIQRAQAAQVALTAADLFTEYWAECNKTDEDIKDDWIKGRGYSFLSVLEAQLKQNNGGKGFYFGDKVSVADLYVADFMRRLRRHKPHLFKECKFEALKGLVERFEALPAMKEYLASEAYLARCGKWDAGKMLFARD